MIRFNQWKRLFITATLVCLAAQPVWSQSSPKGEAVPAGKAGRVESGADAFPFADQANFVVSGVTDWTAVGGHGSDVTLRTSEDLARATSSLTQFDRADIPKELELRHRVDEHPQSSAANKALGEYYLAVGMFQQALSPLQTAASVSQHDADAEYDLAVALRGLGNVQQSQLYLQRALLTKNTADYQHLAGLLAEEEGDSYRAVQHFRSAVQLRPDEANDFAWASELLLHRAVLQAVEVFRNGVAAYPTSMRLKIGLGSALFAAGQYEEAAEQLCSASDSRPDEVEPYLLLGRIDEAAPTPPLCVVKKLARFSQLQDRSAAAPYLYAMALYRREGDGSVMRVESLLRQSLAADPKFAAAYLQLGTLAAKQNRYPEAISLYKQASAIDTTLPELHYRLSIAYDRNHQPDDARRERELHAVLKQRQAELVEQQRRSVKQFVISQQAPMKPDKD